MSQARNGQLMYSSRTQLKRFHFIRDNIHEHTHDPLLFIAMLLLYMECMFKFEAWVTHA